MIEKRKSFYIEFLAMFVAVMLSGCTKGVHGGIPALPLSTTNGTSTVFQTSEIMVLTAISNAFTSSDKNILKYRRMMLFNASDAVDDPTGQYTNGFVLSPFEAVTLVPLAGGKPKSVPYFADFNITTKALNKSNTEVTVKTFASSVIDGQEISIHGAGWASHGRDVPPIKMEEENVLNAISNALILNSTSDRH